MNQRLLNTAGALSLFGLIAAIYWPVRHGGFVWDDMLCFHDAAWLRHGDDWTHYLFRDFCDWTSYFRPLVVALLMLQVRIFDSTPGPMHLVSLGLHLANTLLVGLFALKLLPPANTPVKMTAGAGLAMLVYGLHPALIEPVFWVGCQYELVVTFFMLLGLLFNTTIESAPRRALTVALSFFLAACAKEAAVSFPLLLLVFDLAIMPPDQKDFGWSARLRATWQRQRATYACVLLAGIAYLALRHWALGSAAAPFGTEPLLSFARLQKASMAYLEYWKLLVWPMTGLGPIHPFDEQAFTIASARSLAVDAAAMFILLGGIYASWKRHLLGAIILTVTAALMPVLHIVPIAFNESLYHERYAMTAVAMMCVLLPSLLVPAFSDARSRMAMAIAPLLVIAWLGLAIVNIRITLPLWSDELVLWQWALHENPDSIVAKQHLLSKYVERHDRAHAYQLADALMIGDVPCPICMLDVAYLALNDGDTLRARAALDKIRNAKTLPGDTLFMQEFVLTNGELLELQHDATKAEEAYRDAIKMDPLNPQPQTNLAFLLARQRKTAEARQAMEIALGLTAMDQRSARRREFEQIVATASLSQ